MLTYLYDRPLLRLVVLMLAGMSLWWLVPQVSAVPRWAVLVALFACLFVAAITTVAADASADVGRGRTFIASHLPWVPVRIVPHEPLAARALAAVSSAALVASAVLLGVLLGTLSAAGGLDLAANSTAYAHLTTRMDGYRAALARAYAVAGLQGDALAVVTAMTLGGREALSDQLQEAYNITGTAHLFSLSGLHAAALWGILAAVLPTNRHPRLSTALQIAGLWGFVLLTGARPSLLRAAIMLTIVSCLRLARQRSDSITVLGFTAFVLLIAQPQWLASVSFQMSFVATLAILVAARTVLSPDSEIDDPADRPPQGSFALLFSTLGRMLYASFVVSLFAGLATMPIIAVVFHRLSPLFLPANLVAAPFAGLILALAVGTLLLSPLATFAPLSWLTHFAVWLTTTAAGLLNGSLTRIASLPVANAYATDTAGTLAVLLQYAAVAALLAAAYHWRPYGRIE